MIRMRFLSTVIISVTLFALSGCGKNNLFSWAHTPGGSSDTKALEADAITALQDKDYAKALEYFKKILESEPNNADAIYGYASARLADAGLDIGALVANFVKQQASSPSNLTPAFAVMGKAQQASRANLLPQTIISNISNIKLAVDDVIPRLSQISRGLADGKIDPDNADVNLNLAFCFILRAALTVENSTFIQFDTDYQVSSITGTPAQLNPVANDAARDINRAYYRILRVQTKLGFNNDSAMAKVNKDVKKLFDDLKLQLQRDYSITIATNIDPANPALEEPLN